MQNETARQELKKVIWTARRRTFFGLPWTFTRYHLSQEKLVVESGFFRHRVDEIRLYRIKDVLLKRNLRERILGLGTIFVASSDHTMGDFEIQRVRNSRVVAESLSDLVEESRRRNRVVARELLGDNCGSDHYMM